MSHNLSPQATSLNSTIDSIYLPKVYTIYATSHSKNTTSMYVAMLISVTKPSM